MASGLIQFAFVLASGIINYYAQRSASCLRDVKICGRCELRGGNCAAAAANLVTPPAPTSALPIQPAAVKIATQKYTPSRVLSARCEDLRQVRAPRRKLRGRGGQPRYAARPYQRATNTTCRR
ncbi:hypothetical protein ACJJTC_007797 [Scirpophaga incertulas]